MIISYAFLAIILLTNAKILSFFALETLLLLLADMVALNLSDSLPFNVGVAFIVVAITNLLTMNFDSNVQLFYKNTVSSC